MCQADAQTRGLSKVMKLQKIGLSGLISILAALTIGEFRFISNSQFKIINSQALAQTQVERKAEADRLFQQGIQQAQISQFQPALQSSEQALIIYREIKDRQGEGAALGSLGIAYRNLGGYAKAIEYLQQWLAIARSIKDRNSEGAALGNLGLAYYALGDYAKAIEYQQQSLAIALEIKDRKAEANALENLANAYLSLGKPTQAIDYAQQQLVVAEEINDTFLKVTALGNVGLAYLDLGNYGQGMRYIHRQLLLSQEIQDPRSKRIALGTQGIAYLKLSDYLTSLADNQGYLSIPAGADIVIPENMPIRIPQFPYRGVGNYTNAIIDFKQWLTVAREISDRHSQGLILNLLGYAFYLQGNLNIAEKTLRDGIEVNESLRIGLDDAYKVSIFETQARTYLNLQEVLIAQKKTNDALEIAERGRARAFVELLASRLAPSASAQTTINPPNIQQIQQIAKEQNATLVEYSTIRNEALYIWVIKPTGEITFRSVDLKSLNINLPEVTERARVSAAQGTRGLNDQDTAIAEMIRGTREALGVSAGDTANKQTANPPASTPANSRIIYPKLQQIYQLLIQPIADLLPADPNAPVIFIPHQSLFLVPFVALQDPTGQYLIEKHTILTAPAIQILQFTRQSRQKVRQIALQNNLVVGNPIMPKIGIPPRQLKPLPGSEREAITIAQLLNTQAITGSQATKASITQQMLKARIIHLATHGLLEVKRRDLPGAIALAPSGNDDGLLTSSEILDLKLNAELVVLSACSTGRGKLTGDGVLGLSRALISAGVPSIIVSLWPVPDNSTAELMAEFYRQLQLNPNKAQALRQAMLMTMKMHPNPQDWAAFTLIGEAE
jgi:CHAT domain-containing protein